MPIKVFLNAMHLKLLRELFSPSGQSAGSFWPTLITRLMCRVHKPPICSSSSATSTSLRPGTARTLTLLWIWPSSQTFSHSPSQTHTQDTYIIIISNKLLLKVCHSTPVIFSLFLSLSCEGYPLALMALWFQFCRKSRTRYSPPSDQDFPPNSPPQVGGAFPPHLEFPDRNPEHTSFRIIK